MAANQTISKKKRIYIEPYVYLVPAFLIFIVFTYWPFFRTIYRSLFLTDNRGIEKVFVGF